MTLVEMQKKHSIEKNNRWVNQNQEILIERTEEEK